MNGTLQLHEYPGGLVRLSCEKFGRANTENRIRLRATCYRWTRSRLPSWLTIGLLW